MGYRSASSMHPSHSVLLWRTANTGLCSDEAALLQQKPDLLSQRGFDIETPLYDNPLLKKTQIHKYANEWGPCVQLYPPRVLKEGMLELRGGHVIGVIKH